MNYFEYCEHLAHPKDPKPGPSVEEIAQTIRDALDARAGEIVVIEHSVPRGVGK